MPEPTLNFYQALGVAPTATPKEIKAAYRKLARKYHPDANPEKSSDSERIKEINQAYDILGDEEKRKAYDAYGSNWEHYEQWVQAGKPGGTYQDPSRSPYGSSSASSRSGRFSELDLNSLFGNQEGSIPDLFDFFSPRPQRGANLEGEISISLEEAYRGATRTLELATGNSTRRLELAIPPGIADGAVLRAAGQGQKGAAGSGDVLVRVKIAPHPNFTRVSQNHLQTTLSVPLKIMLLGGTVLVPTLKGKQIELSVPANSQNQARLRLRGQGMPIANTPAFGDLLVELKVQLPVPLSAHDRKVIEQLADPA